MIFHLRVLQHSHCQKISVIILYTYEIYQIINKNIMEIKNVFIRSPSFLLNKIYKIMYIYYYIETPNFELPLFAKTQRHNNIIYNIIIGTYNIRCINNIIIGRVTHAHGNI